MNHTYGRALAILLLLIFLGLALGNARHASITVDEGLHIASGYTILVTGDYRLVEEHPPLIKLWMALPLLPLPDLPDPTILPAWDTSAYDVSESIPLLRMAQQLLYPYLPVDKWLFPARYMCILLGILFLSLLYRWADDLWDHTGGLLVLGFTAFDPNILANSAIAGTDIGSTFFILLVLWVGGKYFKIQKSQHALLTGLALGLALTSKLTAVLVILPLGCLGLVNLIYLHGKARKRLVINLVLLLLIAFLTMWCIYRFQIGRVPTITMPVPMPAHFTPLMRLLQHARGGHQAYLFGENSMDGWWTYFPLAFMVKTPLALLIFLPLAIISSLRLKQWRGTSSILVLLFLLVYTSTSLISPLNIGYRHILPVLFILYLWLGAITYIRKSWIKILATILLLFQVTNTVYYSPYLLGWFNSISGGPKQGWRYLADSNTDWGQGYQALSQYQHTHNIPTLQLAGFVFYDPAIYDLNYDPLTPLGGNTPAVFPSRFAPPPGHYAISMTSLDGIPLADNEMYDWFRWTTPTARIANAIHYYYVEPEDTATHWVAQCIDPVPPLSVDTIEEGFGQRPLQRYIPFDCAQSWIRPQADAGSGVYIIHGMYIIDNLASKLHYIQPGASNNFIDQHLEEMQIIYQQRQYRDNPAFSIYRTNSGEDVDHPPSLAVWAAPAENPPLNPDDRIEVKTPILMSAPLQFLGIHIVSKNPVLEIESRWEVITDSREIPALSIMAHILNEAGEIIDIADGLGIAPSVWAEGDVITQLHRFTVHDRQINQFLLFRTGLYWLESGERMSLMDNPDADALYVLLQ